MADSATIEFWIGTTWTLFGTARDANGDPLDLTGGSVELRIASPTGLVIKLASPDDIAIQVGNQGGYVVNLDAGDARQAALAPGSYRYEAVAVTQRDAGSPQSVTVEDVGRCTLHRSIRSQFPG